MATAYPNGRDTFTEPTLPEEITLSQAGPDGRSHPRSHRDQGDAIEALQEHASQKTHTHDGTDSATGGPKLAQANTHEDSDVDTAQGMHHTLGTGATQAAPGNHTHNYADLPGVPFVICTSGTRPGAPTTGMVIYETDTKVFRQWDLHANAVIVDGLNSTVRFDTPSPTGIGGTGWATPKYSSGGTANGIMATPDGTLQWLDGGNATNTGWVRRTDPLDAESESDDQIITWKTGDIVIEGELPLTDGATNDIYFRVSADEQQYMRLRIGDNYVKLFYTTDGRANEKHLGTLDNISTRHAATVWQGHLIGRDLRLYRTGEHMGTIRDTKLVTAKGPDNRGWMVGMQAGARVLGQTTPADIEWVRIQDMRYYASANRWTLLNMGALPVCRLRQSKTQQLNNTGTILEFTEEVEDNFGYFDKSISQTDVVVSEPGLYDAVATLQWDTQRVPDQAHAVIMLNSQETYIRDSKFLRGGSAAQPGFSQTLAISGAIRLAPGDVIQVKAKYSAPGGLLGQIFSYFDAASRVNSRLELIYRGP